jgi:glycine dehydrogenase subunit 2
MNRQGRPTEPVQAIGAAPSTFTGNRALRIEEALIFEIGRTEVTGVDLDEPADFEPRLGGLERKTDRPARPLRAGAVRHYVRLSRMNYGIDTGVFPLGSCTMKHNPRLNEKMARLPGFGDIHPLQPQSTVPGALALIAELSRWLCELTGMPAVALSAQGRRAWRAVRHDGDQGGARRARREARSIVLVPESAHGTNPATAALLGYRVETIPARRRHGRSRGGEEAPFGPTSPPSC